jgi:hypothetical protein
MFNSYRKHAKAYWIVNKEQRHAHKVLILYSVAK